MIEDGFPISKESEWKAVPGMMAGALELIRPDTSKTGSGLKEYWLCKCHKCNRPDLVSKRLDNLKIGAIGGKVYATGRKCNGTRSCGCKQKTQFVNANTTGVIYEDLTGQILNDWKLVQKTFMKDIHNGSFLYVCESIIHPECFEVLSIRHLKDGYCAQAKFANKKYLDIQHKIKEVRPRMSKNEEKILNLLKDAKIHGCMQSTFEKCKAYSLLPFDFFIEGKYIIEYDGRQHFHPIEIWGGEEGLAITRAYDLIKNKYCFENIIPLIRIPYDADYTINDLKLETTRFLLTPENEKDYYESRK